MSDYADHDYPSLTRVTAVITLSFLRRSDCVAALSVIEHTQLSKAMPLAE